MVSTPTPIRKKTQRASQRDMTEREVNDPELLAALEQAEENADAAKAYRDAVAEYKRIVIEVHQAQPGETIRCGEFIVPVSERSGGDTEIKPWTRTVVGAVKSAASDTIDD